MTDAATTQTTSSISSAIRFGRGCRAEGMGSASRSIRQSAAKHSSRSGKPYDTGHSTNAATRRWTIWHGCSTTISVAGSTTTAVSTSLPSIPPCGTSTVSWHDGRIGSSSPSDATSDGHITGSSTLCAVSLICSHTGVFCMDAAEQWEPDEARASRPVLREAGGEIPPAYSPDCLFQLRQQCPWLHFLLCCARPRCRQHPKGSLCHPWPTP